MQLEDVISKCKKNDRKAQKELYEWGFNTLMRMAYRYKRNEEDAAVLVNEAFFKVLTNLDKYDPLRSFEGWMVRIMKNTIIDDYRKEQTKAAEFKGTENMDDPSLDLVDHNLIENEFDVEDIQQMMNQLSDEERHVFNLYEIEGYSHKEIGDMLSVTERSSKRYLASAKKRLRGMVGSMMKAAVLFSMLCTG